VVTKSSIFRDIRRAIRASAVTPCILQDYVGPAQPPSWMFTVISCPCLKVRISHSFDCSDIAVNTLLSSVEEVAGPVRRIRCSSSLRPPHVAAGILSSEKLKASWNRSERATYLTLIKLRLRIQGLRLTVRQTCIKNPSWFLYLTSCYISRQ
jgi:hypothetical protein